MYTFSLNKMIENIYQNNFFKDDLQITIYTTLNPAKLKEIRKSIKLMRKDVYGSIYIIYFQIV